MIVNRIVLPLGLLCFFLFVARRSFKQWFHYPLLMVSSLRFFILFPGCSFSSIYDSGIPFLANQKLVSVIF